MARPKWSRSATRSMQTSRRPSPRRPPSTRCRRRRTARRTASKERVPSAPNRAGARPKLRPSYERQYRQTIRVDLWSVLKISICFYLSALIVLLVAGVCCGGSRRPSGSSQHRELRRRPRQQQGLPLPVVGGAARVDAHRARDRVPAGRVTVLAAAFYNLFSRCSAASRSPSSKRSRSAPSDAHAGRVEDVVAGWG